MTSLITGMLIRNLLDAAGNAHMKFIGSDTLGIRTTDVDEFFDAACAYFDDEFDTDHAKINEVFE